MHPIKNPIPKVLLVFFAALAVGAYFSEYMINIFRSFLPVNVILVSFSPADVFMSVLWVVVMFALVFTIPVAL